MLKLNTDKDFVKTIINGVNKKEGYCPCLILKNEDSKCPFFENILELNVSEESVCIYSQKNIDVEKEGCHCKLYIPD